MIRFLGLRGQIEMNTPSFAFYDTVDDVILSFGKQNQQVFDSIEEFKDAYAEDQNVRPLERFMQLIPEGYFVYVEGDSGFDRPSAPTYIMCSDCGSPDVKETMHWGHNSWNKKKFTDAEYAYVCDKCWQGRGGTGMGIGAVGF